MPCWERAAFSFSWALNLDDHNEANAFICVFIIGAKYLFFFNLEILPKDKKTITEPTF